MASILGQRSMRAAASPPRVGASPRRRRLGPPPRASGAVISGRRQRARRRDVSRYGRAPRVYEADQAFQGCLLVLKQCSGVEVTVLLRRLLKT